ncbi:intraflagellar transport protein 43 homolog isoform X2 [Armigeres subalbatus]|uniref:intraflagellar transport protein 43 homolog isoform X2 n=1 Tax=Armigeres subalbatus TaxID=124917 RepID=UPI002ED02206
MSSSDTAATTPTRVKTDSWMDDVLRTNTVSNKERFGNSNNSDDSNTVEYNPDDIPMLPDADELHESLFYNESPNLPSLTMYNQLGSDIFPNSKSALGNLDEIDISILTECLEHEDSIEEADEPWIWDQLFAQLSVKISTETKSTSVEYKN